jgi:hypothetical protein
VIEATEILKILMGEKEALVVAECGTEAIMFPAAAFASGLLRFKETELDCNDHKN